MTEAPAPADQANEESNSRKYHFAAQDIRQDPNYKPPERRTYTTASPWGKNSRNKKSGRSQQDRNAVAEEKLENSLLVEHLKKEQERIEGPADKPQDGEKEKRLGPKKLVALLVGYSGKGYSGLQFNPGVETIESHIFTTLVALNLISRSNAVHPNKVSWNRCCRTDAGVSCLVNLITLKMVVTKPLEEHRKDINEMLRDGIKIWRIQGVLGSFVPKVAVDERIYEYTFPLSLLHSKVLPPPIEQVEATLAAAASQTELERSSSQTLDHDMGTKDGPEKNINGTELKEEDEQQDAEDKPITDADLSEDEVKLVNNFRELLPSFVGRRNFHNFTPKKLYGEESSWRIIRRAELMLSSRKDVKWVTLQLQGQSFMLHQIRKMIAACIFIVRYGLGEAKLRMLLGPRTENVPKAPGAGLYLVQPIFGSYNKRLEQLKSSHSAIEPTIHESTDVASFKSRYVLPSIIASHEVEDKFNAWLSTVEQNWFDVEWVWRDMDDDEYDRYKELGKTLAELGKKKRERLKKSMSENCVRKDSERNSEVKLETEDKEMAVKSEE